jgi:hypothetical protein
MPSGSHAELEESQIELMNQAGVLVRTFFEVRKDGGDRAAYEWCYVLALAQRCIAYQSREAEQMVFTAAQEAEGTMRMFRGVTGDPC